MSDSIQSVVKEELECLEALRMIEKKWPGASSRSYKTETAYIKLWQVDMNFEDCDSFILVHPDKSHRPGSTSRLDEVGVVIFKNLAPGINIAPREHHYMTVQVFFQRVSKKPELHERVCELISSNGW